MTPQEVGNAIIEQVKYVLKQAEKRANRTPKNFKGQCTSFMVDYYLQTAPFDNVFQADVEYVIFRIFDTEPVAGLHTKFQYDGLDRLAQMIVNGEL